MTFGGKGDAMFLKFYLKIRILRKCYHAYVQDKVYCGLHVKRRCVLYLYLYLYLALGRSTNNAVTAAQLPRPRETAFNRTRPGHTAALGHLGWVLYAWCLRRHYPTHLDFSDLLTLMDGELRDVAAFCVQVLRQLRAMNMAWMGGFL